MAFVIRYSLIANLIHRRIHPATRQDLCWMCRVV